MKLLAAYLIAFGAWALTYHALTHARWSPAQAWVLALCFVGLGVIAGALAGWAGAQMERERMARMESESRRMLTEHREFLDELTANALDDSLRGRIRGRR